MKKILLGMGALISFLFLLGSCSSAASSGSSNDDDNKSKDTANEKAELYKSAIGEYTNYSMDKTFSIAETLFMFEGMSYTITPETDLYYENELPAEKSFTGKYTLVTGCDNTISPLYLNKIVGKEDNDTLSLEKWMEHYYFEEEDLEAHNTYVYEAEQKNEEWYQLLSDGFYDYNNDVYYKKNYQLRKYHTPSGYSKILYLCPKTSSYIFGLCYNSDGKLSTLYRFEANRIGLDCRIKKIKDLKKDRLKKTDEAFSWYGLEDENGNHYTIIDPVGYYSDLDKLVEEFFAEEIEESGLSVYQWQSAHSIEWNEKKDEIKEYYSNKEEELVKEETYEGIIETAYSVYPKNSGSSDSGNDSDDDDDDDDNGSGSGGSIDASDFEGITWKYVHENVSSTTTQNVVFENGTITVKTITTSNNSNTSTTNREETASYELDGDKITITYSKYGYDTTAEFTISVEGNSLTLEGDDDDYDAISLLGTLFQNTSGTASITFTKD